MKYYCFLIFIYEQHIKFLMEAIVGQKTTVKELKEDSIIPELRKCGDDISMSRLVLMRYTLWELLFLFIITYFFVISFEGAVSVGSHTRIRPVYTLTTYSLVGNFCGM